MSTNNTNVPLTPYQALFYYEWLKDPLRSDYNMVMDSLVSGKLDLEKCEQAFLKMVNEHFAFNHNPATSEDGFYWKAKEKASKLIDYYPSKLTDEDMYDIVSAPFNLEEDHPVRLSIIKLEEDKYRIFIVMPHLVIDGLTTHLIYEKWAAIYNGGNYDLQSYEEQIELSRNLSAFFEDILAKNKEKIDQFWSKHLQDVGGIDFTFLKTNIVKPKSPQRYVSECLFSYDKEIASRVSSLRHNYKITPYIFGQLVLAVLVHKVTGQKNIAINYPIALLEGADYIYGAHVNSILIDYRFQEDTTIGSLITYALDFFKQLKTTKSRYLPIPEIVQYAEDTNVLELAFAQTFLRDIDLGLEGITLDKVYHQYQIDLVNTLLFEQEQHEGKINYRVKYDKDVLDPDLVKQFCSLYKELFLRILDDLTADNDTKKMQEYRLLDDDEYQNIIVDYNQRRVPFSEEKTLSQIIEEHAARLQDKTALICNDNILSYKQLNEQANQLAHYLKEQHNVERGDCVGLFLDKTPWMMVSILAILKAGAAYVPMDSSMPDERISFILSDTKAKVTLTNQIYKQKMERLTDNVIALDDDSFAKNILPSYSSDNLGKIAASTDLAYIIYTSGTTGTPKGVMIQHRNVNRLIINTNFVSIDETDTILSLSSYQFDGSVYDFFAPLLNGATLVLSPKEVFLNLDDLNDLIGKHNVTNFFVTTSLFNTITDANLPNLKQLKYIIAGGEAASLTHMRRFRENFGNVKIINGYGPTETTVFANCYQVGDDITEFAHSVPIGKPIHNTTSYILDQYLQPLPLGAIGELYIGGAGVSKGYLNNPELTAERFIPNPFQTEEEKKTGYNDRLYKTGDLVRMLPDGNIDYAGRNDFQVKIRGFRIELSEIETAFTSYPDANITQAVVLAKKHTSGAGYLVAYYVSETKLDEDSIRNYLAEKIPDYMIPSIIIHLTELPTTVNGKLDIRQLPEFSLADKENYVAPENETEQKLVNIFAEVLNLDPTTVSTTDDFYRLGGNSIQVIRLTSKINEALGIKIHVTSVFENTTVKKLVDFISKDTSQLIQITKSAVEKQEDQVLSFAQQRLWFIESYEGGSNAYNIPLTFKLEKDVDLSLLETSIRMIIDRHEILRSLIKANQQGKGYQVVIDSNKNPIVFENQTVSNKDELKKEMDKSVTQIFDLSKDYPIHIKFYTLNSETYVSIIVHHIVFDGWSTEIFIKEMLDFYQYQLLLKKGDEVAAKSFLPAPIEIQYRDFSIWQRNYLQGEVLAKQLNFWSNHLCDFETLNLATDKPRPTQIDYRGADIEFIIDAQTSAQLVELAKKLNVSMYNLLLSAYYLLLSAYSNQEDIVIGSPIAGRQYPEIADTIGFFVNTLAIRQKIDGQQALSEFISQVAKTSREAQNNQDLPFEKLIEELNIDKDSSRHPIVQVMFGVQSFGKQQLKEINKFMSLYTEGYGANFGVAKFDITTMIDDSGECIEGVFNYATSLFEEHTIKSYINSYVHILKQFANLNNETQSSIRIKEIQLLDTKTYDLIVNEWNNNTKKEYDNTRNICQVFEQQVVESPNKAALVFKDTQLTYAQLNEKANQLAHHLKENRGVEVGDRVALSLNNSEYMIIGILGILKAGAAYVPMETDLVNERLSYIVNDSRVDLLLTDEKHSERLQNIFSDSDLKIEAINSPLFIEEVFESSNIQNLELTTRPDNLSYIIYTSGTTGNPKGVMTQHKNVVNFALNANYVNIGESDVTLSLSSYQFDGSVYDFFMPLLRGATLVLSDKKVFLDLEELNKLIEKNNVTNFFITTSLFNTITDAKLSNLKQLKYILAGGEAASLAHMRKFKETFGNVQIVNGYGPTETTVFANCYQIDDTISEFSHSVPIGKPITNATSYILDKWLKPLPLGAIGELYIGGAGVAKGYLNNPELTAERFIPNPFQTEDQIKCGDNDRLYKTGDLVRYLPDGYVEYIGRNDFQVKIRGYRIEMGEIETVLNSHPDIKQSAVIAKSHHSGIKYLVGYYMSDQKIQDEEFYAYLGATLPEYMIPCLWVHMVEFPLNINGKTDRRKLPDIEFSNQEIYIAPENDAERELCGIYGDVLGLDAQSISVESDFFQLGGDSISSIQLVNRIRQQMDVHLAVRDIFDHKTIRSLYNNKVKNNNQAVQKIQSEQGILSGEVELLPIQQWFFSNVDKGLLPEYNHFNQAFILKVPKLDEAILRASVLKLTEYHDAFRLSFHKTEDQYTQSYDTQITESPLLCLDVIGLSDQEITDTFTKWQSSFDIFKNNLFHIAYLSGFSDGTARIHVAMHHLIVDAVSWRLIKNDLETIYNHLYTHQDDAPVATILGEKRSSYRQWVDAVGNYKNTATKNEFDYWKSASEGINKSNSLMAELQSDTLNKQELILDNTLTDSLIRKVHTAYNSQINDVLLTALHRSLSKLTGSHTQYILLEGHGREYIANDIDINNTVGWFTIMYPVQLSASTHNWGESLTTIKDMLHAIPNNGIGYGALVGYTSKELPRISFNYLGQFDSGQQSKDQWNFSDEDSGLANSSANRDNNILSINGGVVDGKLKFAITGYFDQETLTELTHDFKEQLTALITYLEQADRSYLTLCDTDYIVSKSYLDTIQTKQEVEGVYLANSLQQGFIFHAINQKNEDDAYKIQIVWKYSSPIDPDTFKQAWQAVQKTYPSLRLRFAWEEELVQIVDKTGSLNWEYIDISQQDQKQQDRFMQDLLVDDRQLEFDLQKSALFRIYLIKQSDNEYACLFSNHHAILDGWSMPVLISTLHEYYTELSNSQHISYKADPAYTLTQKYLHDNKQESVEYWDNYLSDFEASEDLSSLLKFSKRSTKLADYNKIEEAGVALLRIEEKSYQDLKQFCMNNEITLNALLQYCWHKQLSLYGNTDTTVLGMTIAGRSLPIENIEQSVGLYINTLPIILQHTDEKVIESVKRLQSNINDINSHSGINLTHLQKNGVRLFNTLFVFENFPKAKKDESNQLDISIDYAKEKLDYPIGVSVFEDESGMDLKIQYAGELFDKSTIDQLLEGMSGILTQLVEKPSLLSNELNFVNEKEFEKTIYQWNRTTEAYPESETIVSLFENQVEKTPSNIAFVYDNHRLTYKQVNEQANHLGAYLKDTFHINPDNIVALYLKRSQHMLTSMLGVMKASAAYLPIDVNVPKDRLRYMLQDTEAKVILCNEDEKDTLQSKLEGLPISVIAIDTPQLLQYIEQKYSAENLPTNIKPNNLIYIIYTSGTTGNPKGVMLEHRGIVNLATAMAKEMKLDSGSIKNCLWYASYVFDAHAYEIYKAIITGNPVFLVEEDKRRDIELLRQYIADNRIEIATIPPALLEKDVLLNLKTLTVAGESTAPEIMNNYRTNGIRLINAYGPTEDSVCSTFHHFELGDSHRNIGRPIANTTAYILNRDMKPLPIGATGELYVGGAGIARGYLKNSELTASVFKPNPFQTTEEKQKGYNAYLYKTGDLARFLDNGDIEFIGRSDFQVKIRGFRIELGEIESLLMSYPEVEKAIVLVHEQATGVKSLVGYYVSEQKLDEEKIIQYLENNLPEYMIPSLLMHLTDLPMTINGKINRRELPLPDWSSQENYVAPQNEAEIAICNIFSNLLGIEASIISAEDDFFRLGGSSILAIKLMNQLNKEFRTTVSIATVFTHKTIRKLAEYIEFGNQENISISKVSVSNPEDQVLSFAQERIWFIESYEGGSNAYNIPLVFEISEKVNIESLEKAIATVVHRHEILRSYLKTTGEGTGYQLPINDEMHPVQIHKQTLHSEKELHDAINSEVSRIFNLEFEYPIHIQFYICEGRRYVSIIMHHIASDGWSTDIFIKELMNYYGYEEALRNNASPEALSQFELPENPIQYKDYALWQRNYLEGEKLDVQLNYWKNKLAGYETLNLPTDKTRPVRMDYAGSNFNFKLNEELSQQLRERAKELNVSLYSLLLSGYYLLLSAYSNQEDIVIGTPVAGRHYSEVKDLIGLFVNTLVLRTQIDSTQNISDFITQIGNSVNEAQCYQDLPFEKLVNDFKVEKDTSRNPIFQIMFGLQSFGNSESVDNELFKAYNDIEHLGYHAAKFDITTMMDDSQTSISGVFNYATSLFEDTTMATYAESYTKILEQLALNQPDTQIKEITYLPEADYQKMVVEWNHNPMDYPSDKTIHQMFEEQVVLYPDNIAIDYEDKQVSYLELNTKANRLAAFLRDNYDTQPNEFVGLVLDRSDKQIISILAVLKSGAAYLPMDPKAPQDRLTFMVQDSAPKIILTNQSHLDRLKKALPDSIILAIDNLDFEAQLELKYSGKNIDTNVGSHALAYLIYTSGTTGIPKGVMIEHCNVLNLFGGTKNLFDFNANDVWTLFHSYTFDFSVWELWGPLFFGGKLLVPTYEQTRDFNMFYDLCSQKGITVLSQTPNAFYQFSEIGLSRADRLSKLRYVVFGGEALNLEQLQPWYNVYQDNSPYLINMYGITETTVHTTYKKLSKNDLNKGSLIGKPLPNYNLYLLNKDMQPLAIGAIGEMYVGGEGVARGYLNRDELTAERFLPNPFQTNEQKEKGINSRLYKSGDLARFLPNGELEYIGRNDFQVKIRGFRIELGEIETNLLAYPFIKKAVVLSRKQSAGDNYLAAYYVADKELDKKELENHLLINMPEYMVPKVFVHMNEFPLTINGKLDRKQLPEPTFVGQKDYIAPQTEEEKNLAILYGEVLNLDPTTEISVEDDFYTLGGNSILAIRLVYKINNFFNIKMRLVDIINTKSIRQLASTMNKSQYKAIVELNQNDQEPIFMIHPGMGGCEVYLPLASRLEPYYHCYGIDSYNLYHDNKIKDLGEIAEYYLSELDKLEKKPTSYKFLGWSLGGQIALEIAAKLEKRGETNITVYLLDTWINVFSADSTDIDMDAYLDKFIERFGIQDANREEIITNMSIDTLMHQQPISLQLEHTKGILFKAVKGLAENLIDQYPYNNIEKNLVSSSQFKIKPLETDHHSILDFDEVIVNDIISLDINDQ